MTTTQTETTYRVGKTVEFSSAQAFFIDWNIIGRMMREVGYDRMTAQNFADGSVTVTFEWANTDEDEN